MEISQFFTGETSPFVSNKALIPGADAKPHLTSELWLGISIRLQSSVLNRDEPDTKQGLYQLNKNTHMWNQDPFVHYGVGVAKNWLHAHEEACKHYLQSIEIAGEDWALSAASYVGAANALFCIEQDDQAFRYTEQALLLHPEFARAWVSRGSYFMDRVGDLEKALQSFEIASELNQEDPVVHLLLSKAHLYAGNENQAMKTLDYLDEYFAELHPEIIARSQDIRKEWNAKDHGIFGLSFSERRKYVRKNAEGFIFPR